MQHGCLDHCSCFVAVFRGCFCPWRDGVKDRTKFDFDETSVKVRTLPRFIFVDRHRIFYRKDNLLYLWQGGKSGRKGPDNQLLPAERSMDDHKNKEKQNRKNTGEDSCFYGLVKEYSEKRPVRMVIYVSGGTPLDTAIEKGVIILDGEKLRDQEAERFVSRHRRDLERLLFEAARSHSKEKEYRRDLQIASIADKAGEKGTWARISIGDREMTRTLQIGRDKGAPVFMIDGRKAEKEEAVRLIRDNYEQFTAGLHKAEWTLRNYYRGRKEVSRKLPGGTASIQNGKITVDLDKKFPAREKTSPDLNEVRKITGKHFAHKHTRSYLK